MVSGERRDLDGLQRGPPTRAELERTTLTRGRYGEAMQILDPGCSLAVDQFVEELPQLNPFVCVEVRTHGLFVRRNPLP
jgi:hypothetical protein